MTRDEIIRMAEKAGMPKWLQEDWFANPFDSFALRFAYLIAAAERENVAAWMIQHSYATGHGETTEDLLAELDWQIAENWNRAMINGVETEREACAVVCDRLGDEFSDANAADCAQAIRARGQQ